MLTYNLFDVQFRNKEYATGVNTSPHFKWSRDKKAPDEGDISFYTDIQLRVAINHVGRKFGWLIESPEIYPGTIDWIRENHHYFERVFTHQESLLKLGNPFLFNPGSTCWIRVEDFAMYKKSKLISMIASKKGRTSGHKFRLKTIKYVETEETPIDLFGKDFKGRRLHKKIDGLRDYAFSVAVENAQRDYYFTEKLIDCFATGTVPIYYGCPSIGNFFNPKGMLIFNTIEELCSFVPTITFDLYKQMLPFVKENFELSKKYDLDENYMYNNYASILNDS